MLESSAFTAVALLSTRFGKDAVAAYEIAGTIIRIAHFPPIGIGVAATVMIGRALSAGEPAVAADLARAASLAVAVLMLPVALPLLVLPAGVGAVFSSERAVLEAMGTLLPIAAVIVVADGLQAVIAGSLRGHGDVFASATLHVFSFWLVTVPLAFFFAIGLGWSVNGCAAALACGLLTASGVLLLRLRWLQRPAPGGA